MKNRQSNTLMYVFLLLLVSLVLLLPLLKPGFIVTDDADWMVIRLTAFYQSFADGQFPVRFLGRLNFNYGYPVANFLYPGFLYIGSFLRALKLPFTTIIELILGGSVIVSGVFAFLWLKKFFSGFASFIGACSLLLSPYFLYDLYKRGSVGELLCTAFMMMVLWSIESGFLWFLPPLTALLLLSHNTLSLLYGLFIIGYIVLRKKGSAIIPLLIGLCMTLFFWIPAFFERTFVRFDLIQVASSLEYFPVSHMLLLKSIPFFVPLLYFFRKKKEKFIIEYFFMAGCLIVSVCISSFVSAAFWKLDFFVYFIQFPYRILSIVFIVGPWLLSFFITKIQKWKGIVASVFLILLGIGNVSLLWNVRSIVRDEGFYTTNEGTTTVQDEYMPRWVQYKPQERANEKLVLFSGKGKIKILHNTTKRLDADLEFEENSIVEFNTIFYPGWGAVLDGKPVEISYQNKRGIMQVSIPKGRHTISFEFRETAFRYIIDVFTSFGVILYGMYLLYYLTKGIQKKTHV